MASINPRMSELIESLLDRYKLPADCRELKTLLADRGFEVSHSSLYAWKRNTQGISDAKKRGFAEALNFDYDKFNAFLDGKISLQELESSEEIQIPLDEQDVSDWVERADPGDLLSIQQKITKRLIQYFDSEFESLESILNYAIKQLMEQAIAQAKEEGKRISEPEAFAIALDQFAEEAGLETTEVEQILQNPSNITPEQVSAIADAIDWEESELQEVIDSSKSQR